MKPIQIISQDLFDKVRSRFTNLEMGDETGAVTIDPAEARFFDFDFVNEGVNLGRVSISLNDLGSLKIYYSQGITENQDDVATQMWYNFLKEMRLFSMRRLLRFDTRDIAKTNLDKNDFQHLAATQGPKEEPDMNNTMNESRWNHKSSRKTSRAVQGKTEVIVRHAHPVEETYPGARSQAKNIKAIFIQNHDGERFKYPFIHTAGAFAMAQHVDHGGVPHDPAGKAIIKMSENIAKLGEFQRQIQRSSLHDDAHGIAERAIGHMNELKARVAALGKRHHYEAWREDFEMSGMGDDTDEMVLDAVTLEDYKSKFTQTNFQEELVGFFPLLHRIMSETNAVDLEEYVSEQSVTEDPDRLGIGQQMARDGIKYSPDKENELIDLMAQYMKKNGMSSKEIRYHLNYDEDYIPDQLSDLPKEGSSEGPPFDSDTKSNFSKPNNPNRTGMDSARALAQRGMSPAESINTFEEWANATEQGKLTDEQIRELKAAIEALPQGPQGPELDFDTAHNFFSEFGLDDKELQKSLQDEQSRNPEIQATPLQIFQSWANENYPELLTSLGMTGEEPAPEAPPEEAPPPEAGAAPAAPAPTAPPAPEQPVAEGKGNKVVQEVAKIVKSFYNQSNESVGPFRAPENIALDCKKTVTEKFGEKAGEQAYEMAEVFINKLTQEWHQKHGHVKQNPVDHGDGLSVDSLKEILGRIKSKVEGISQPAEETPTDETAIGNALYTQRKPQEKPAPQNNKPEEKSDDDSILGKIKNMFSATYEDNKEKDNWHPSKHITDPQKKKELAPHDKDVERGSYADRAAYLDAAGVKRTQEEGSKDDFRTHGMDSQPSKEKPNGNPAPTDWKKDPIAATTDRAYDAGKAALQRLAGIRKK